MQKALLYVIFLENAKNVILSLLKKKKIVTILDWVGWRDFIRTRTERTVLLCLFFSFHMQVGNELESSIKSSNQQSGRIGSNLVSRPMQKCHRCDTFHKLVYCDFTKYSLCDARKGFKNGQSDFTSMSCDATSTVTKSQCDVAAKILYVQ